jgi:cellulose 1,4-beta-cellobiosidase
MCPDPETCTEKCGIDGVTKTAYEGTYGVKSIPGGVELKFVTQGPYGKNVGSRLYLLGSPDKYKMFKLKNREFTFDADSSNLACGLNGAVYFVEMKEDGGMGGGNKAGAMYGTGYCDAQCPHDVKFMGGKANIEDWNEKTSTGKYGHCCTEMDIWEANKDATAYTPHPCDTEGPLICEGTQCGDLDKKERYKGVCDKDGCDFNSYRMGNHSFYGPGLTVDSMKPITIVTQWLTTDGTDNGDLSEIRRFYVQNGKVIPNSMSSITGIEGNSVTDKLCSQQKKVFGDPDDHAKKGGLKKMGEALDRGVVLVLSLWDDYITGMNWLDESTKNNGHLGYKRGPCPKGSGKPEDLRANHPDASVKYGNIKYGEIGSTVSGLPPATSGPPAPAPSSNSPSPQPVESSSSAGYCCFGGKENGQAPSCNSECHEQGKADPSSWCAKSEANCKDCGMGVWCPEAKKSSGSLFDWIRKDDESSEVLKEDTLPGQHLHPVLVAGGAFAGTGLIALIAAVVIASRARWAQGGHLFPTSSSQV